MNFTRTTRQYTPKYKTFGQIVKEIKIEPGSQKDAFEIEQSQLEKDRRFEKRLQDLDNKLMHVHDPEFARYLILRELNDPDDDPEGDIILKKLEQKYKN